MLTFPAGVRVFFALGPTDMRKGFDGLAMLVQDLLQQNPFGGHLFVFRRRRECECRQEVTCDCGCIQRRVYGLYLHSDCTT